MRFHYRIYHPDVLSNRLNSKNVGYFSTSYRPLLEQVEYEIQELNNDIDYLEEEACTIPYEARKQNKKDAEELIEKFQQCADLIKRKYKEITGREL